MSTTIAAAIFLPLAPLGMWVCHVLGRRAEQQRNARGLADEVEVWLVTRRRG